MSSWLTGKFAVVFNPRVKANDILPGDVLVGLGNPVGDSPGIVLNPKGAPGKLKSVSAFVSQADDKLVAEWRKKLPAGTADIKRFVLEDLSLDTCFAVLAFATRLTPDSSQAISPTWIGYVTDWEQGLYTDTGEVERSVACLHSTLGHSYFVSPTVGDEAHLASWASRLDFRAGFVSCLTFLDAVVAASPDPRMPVLPEGTEAFRRACAHLRFERQNYELALQHGCVCQLLMPLGPDRKVLVDALILEEAIPSGILKLFARSDRNSFTGNGYSLLALHRPGAAGTGNDMVISLDPVLGLNLKELWERLEALETTKWDGKRPADTPRNLASYRLHLSDAELPPPGSIKIGNDWMRPGAPNQPWYDEGGQFTLIAAPKSLDSGELGSRLSWHEDVIPALWSLYRPVTSQDMDIIKRNHGCEPATDIAGEGNRAPHLDRGLVGWMSRLPGLGRSKPRVGGHTKPISDADSPTPQQFREVVVVWKRQGERSAAASPTFHAWLASLADGIDVRSPQDLPRPSEYEIVPVRGGLVVVTTKGATLFNDWTPTHFSQDEHTGIVRTLAKACSKYRLFLKDRDFLDTLIDHHKKALTGYKFTPGENRDIKEKILKQKEELLAIETEFVGFSGSADAMRVREALQRHWGLAASYAEVRNTLEKIESINAQSYDEQHEQRSRSFKTIATAFGAAFLVKELIEALPYYWTPNPQEWLFEVIKGHAGHEELEHTLHLIQTGEWVEFSVIVLGFIIAGIIFVKYEIAISEK